VIHTGRKQRWAHWGPDGWEPLNDWRRAHAESLVVWAALQGWAP
jgi:hypothetical protein